MPIVLQTRLRLSLNDIPQLCVPLEGFIVLSKAFTMIMLFCVAFLWFHVAYAFALVPVAWGVKLVVISEEAVLPTFSTE